MKTSDLVLVGGVAVAAYLLYEKLFGPNSPGAAATNAVGSAIAAPIVAVTNWAYGSFTMTPSGSVILPDGRKINLSQADLGTISFDDATNSGTFSYQGTKYAIPANPSGGPAYDTNGDYHAVYG